MKTHRPSLEITLYSIVFLLALGVRLYNLGAAPLTDAEASWALQALEVAAPKSGSPITTLGSQPAYIFLSALIFKIFGANNFLARFWPALAGAFLVLLPMAYRRQIGRLAAFILACGLALDPGLVASARHAGGPMMAVSLLLWAVTFWHAHRSILAGVTAGLALLCGPAMIIGGIGLALAVTALRFTSRSKHPELDFPADEQSAPPPEKAPAISQSIGAFRLTALAAGVTILVAGTFFFRQPQGLAAWFGTIPAYLQGWILPSGTPALQLVAALLVYQPFAVLFALIGIGRWLALSGSSRSDQHKVEEHARKLILPLLWGITSLILAIAYPGRQVTDLCWFLIPLWTLAAIELQEHLPKDRVLFIAPLQAALIFVLLGLFWITTVATDQIVVVTNLPWEGVRIAILLGILTLGALTTVLVALGWSWEASRSGLVWGLALAFGIYNLGALWGASQLRANLPQELWNTPPATGQADLLMKTLDDLSNWNTSMPGNINVFSTVDAPSMRWILRDYHYVRYGTALPISGQYTGETPAILITLPEQETPQLTSAYRGQDFAWWVRPGWTGILPEDLSNWLTFREAPLQVDKIILWARSDLFSGAVPAEPVPSDSPVFDPEEIK